MKAILFIWSSLFFAVVLSLAFTSPVIAEISVRNYHIKNGVKVDMSECLDLTELIVILPCPQTNQYQTVSNLDMPSGSLLDIPETDDKYIRFSFSQSEIQNLPSTFEVYYEFDVSLRPVNFNFAQITEIYRYDRSSDVYKWYTGASGSYVVPDNPTIQSIGDNIWSYSSDIIDYAQKCYEYVADNYNYLNPNTGIHSLEYILDHGGGDCGNLSSIYVSLLRYKGIPARHIVTIRPNGSYHVWSDFYLEHYGWVPVDVTYKLFNPSGNYFGVYGGDGIVVTKEVYLQLEQKPGIVVHTPLLQTYLFWFYIGDGGCNLLRRQHLIEQEERIFVDICANGHDGSITVSPIEQVSIVVSLSPGSRAGEFADWWVVESTPSGQWKHYGLPSGSMVSGLSPTHQGPLFNLGTLQLLSSTDLTVGRHTFYFGVDLNMNGSLDMDKIYYDSVRVNVTNP